MWSRVGGLRVGDGPAVVISDRVSLRGPGGAAAVRARDGVALVEPGSAADLPVIAARARGVVIGAAWTRDIPLVRAVAALGLPVVVERRHGAALAEWLGVVDYCVAEGNDQVILCERSDLGTAASRAGRVRAAPPSPTCPEISVFVRLRWRLGRTGSSWTAPRRTAGRRRRL